MIHVTHVTMNHVPMWHQYCVILQKGKSFPAFNALLTSFIPELNHFQNFVLNRPVVILVGFIDICTFDISLGILLQS